MLARVERSYRSAWRSAAWLAAAVTWIIVPVWAWSQVREIDAAQAGLRFKCGMPLLGVVMLAVMTMAATTTVGAVFALIAWRKAPGPRRWTSNLQLAFFGFGACACAGFAIYLWSVW